MRHVLTPAYLLCLAVLLPGVLTARTGIPDEGKQEPLALHTFEAADGNDGVTLVWVGDFIEVTHTYDVQRSSNGNTWQTVGSVSCNVAPTGPISYRYFDNSPFAGLNHYRVVRNSGDEEMQTSLPVTILHRAAFDLQVWPNPVGFGEPFNLIYSGEEDHEFQIELVDVQGFRLKRYSIESDAGTNQLTMDADVPRPGRYFLHVFIDDYPVQAYVLVVK